MYPQVDEEEIASKDFLADSSRATVNTKTVGLQERRNHISSNATGLGKEDQPQDLCLDLDGNVVPSSYLCHVEMIHDL